MNFPILKDGSEQIEYRNPAFPVYISSGRLSGFIDLMATCHWHDDFEIIMPCEGYQMYSIDGEHILLETGDILFVNSRHMHYGFSTDGSDCLYICITFRPELLCGNDEIARSYVQPLVSCSNLAYKVFKKDSPVYDRICAAVSRINSLNTRYAAGNELAILGCLYELWHGIHSDCAGSLSSKMPEDAEVAAQRMMLEFIHTHYADKLTLDSIAASGNVCRSRCCRIFRKHVRRTPIDYLNTYRLERSIQLLESTPLSITEIAGRCGFTGASYFTELFTRTKGCPPTQYRRK